MAAGSGATGSDADREGIKEYRTNQEHHSIQQ